MKKFNLLRKSERKSVGTTLALTVGSPSAHRRYSALKHLTFMLLFLLGSLNVWGGDVEIEIVPKSSPSGMSWNTNPGSTQGNFDFTSTDGVISVQGTSAKVTANYLNIYASGTMTFSSSAKIKSIVISATTNGTSKTRTITLTSGDGSLSGNSVSGSVASVTANSNATPEEVTWTNVSGSTSVSFTIGTGQTYFYKFVVTYESTGGGEKTDVTNEQLAWNAASATVTLGETPYSLPSLTNTIPVSVSYQSTDETVATISNMGVVSILKAGSTTIKAVYAGSETLNAKTVQYTLTVSPAPLTPIAGGIVDELVISDFGVTGGYTAFTEKQASNAGHSNAVYAGKAARGGNSTQYNIQLNTIGTGTSAGRGIVTTISGGNAKRVQAIWGTTGTGNTNARYLTVYGSNSAYTGSETTTSGTNLGTITFHTGDEYAYLDIVGDYPYIMIVASGAMYMSQINITWLPKDESKVATPSIDGTANFYPSTNVTITCGTDDADIYYTTDGTAPSTSSTKYTGVFSVNNTTTVKAIAIKEGLTGSEEAVATFTKITPKTVTQAIAAIPNKNDAVDNQYVAGIVCTEGASVNASGQMTYYISDDGSVTNKLQIYKGKNLNNTEFSSVSDLAIGDRVVVFGQLKNFNNTPEMNDGNYLVFKEGPAVATPVFTPDGGGFMGETDVTITCATDGNAIYYTLDNTTPSKSSTPYTGAIHLDATTTIKAIAYIGEESSLIVEKTFTLTDPKTVAEAYDELVSADLENVAVEGIVYDLSISSGNATYWISDDGNAGAKVLEVFKGKGIGGADVAVGDIREGDKVIVFGTLTIYTGGSEDVKEFKQGSRLLSLTRKTVESVAVTGTPTKANYKVGDAFDPAGLTVTVTYNDASHATVAVADCSWEKDPATFDAAGTGLSVSIKATYDGVQSAAFAVEGLNVKAVPTFDDPNYEWQLVTSDAQLVAGKYYVIGSASKGKVAGAISNDILGTVDATIADGAIAYNAFGTDQTADAASAVVFELGGTTGAWTLNEAIDELGQLAYKGNKTVKWETESTAAWAITIADNNATLVPTAANTYHMLYNVSSPRFTIYTSDPAANMLLPQLYVWALKTYKLRYDANGGENAPAAQAADGEGKAIVTDAKPTAPADKVFDKWNTQNDGLGADKVAGNVIDLSAGDVTLYAIWRDPETYNISYDANGGTLIGGEDLLMPENVTEGNAYTVKGNVYEVEGKLFLGWKANDVIYNAGQVIYPTEDMAFVAQWGDPMVTDFMLVTDVKQLKDGDKVYIVADGNYNMALGELNGSVRNPVEIAKQNNHIVNIGNNPVELTLGKSGDDYTFYDGANYLAWTSGNTLTNETSVTDNSTWTITISEGVTTIANKDDNTRKLQYNSSSPRFAAYTSAQKAVSIYKRPDYSRNVSGNYATICLPKAGKIDGASLYEIAYYGETSKKIFFDEIVNGEMEAGIPYIFLPAAGAEKIGVYYSDNTAADAPASNRNGLYGFYDLNDPAATHNITEDAGHYILYNNQYWLVSGRAAYVENYRAYIYLADITPSEPALAPGRRRISMSVNDTQTATGIESAEANEAPHKVLINGELFILRGEKMYNAKGQLVK